MSKLRIELDNLDVQSFDTMPDRDRDAGTVFGHASDVGDPSCAVSYCNDCNATADERVCPPGSNDCPSVNVAYCQTGSCADNGWTGWTAIDPWRGYCSGVS